MRQPLRLCVSVMPGRTAAQAAAETRASILRRRDFLVGAGGLLIAHSRGAFSQAADKRPLIGLLAAGLRNSSTPVTAFLAGMREQGYVEKRDFDSTMRSTDGDYARLTVDAEELVSLKPNVLVAIDPPATLALEKATSTIPIVAPNLVDPVNQGLIQSFARPGGNLTGIAIVVEGLWGKIVEICRQLVPNATSVGVLFNPTNPTHVTPRNDIERAGLSYGLKVIPAGAASKADLDSAFKELTAANVGAVIVIGDPFFIDERAHIAGLAIAARLPAISIIRSYAEAGFLLTYGVDNTANDRRAAFFVTKILKGARAADLPVEFPTRVEMLINRKTAKALGLSVAQPLLLSADEVIE